MKVIEQILLGSRYFAVVTVFVAVLGSVLILVAAMPALFQIFIDIVRLDNFELQELKFNAVKILSLIDLLLIAAGMHMIAAGIYTIFINPEFDSPKFMNISGFDKLKAHIIKLAGIVLIISFLEQAIRHGPSQYLLEYGAAIAFVILSGAVAIYLDHKSEKDLS